MFVHCPLPSLTPLAQAISLFASKIAPCNFSFVLFTVRCKLFYLETIIEQPGDVTHKFGAGFYGTYALGLHRTTLIDED